MTKRAMAPTTSQPASPVPLADAAEGSTGAVPTPKSHEPLTGWPSADSTR